MFWIGTSWSNEKDLWLTICSMQSIWIQQIVKKLKEVKWKQQRKPNNIKKGRKNKTIWKQNEQS